MSQLKELIQQRRMTAGPEGQPLGWLKFGGKLEVSGPLLNRFYRGERGLGIGTIRNMAKWAESGGDTELILALAEYALNVDIKNINGER